MAKRAFLVSDSVTIGAKATASFATNSKLRNPTFKPALITGLRFGIATAGNGYINPAPSADYIYNLNAEISVGSQKLTHAKGLPLAMIFPFSGLSNDTSGYYCGFWRFPKKMYIPAGAFVSIQFTNYNSNAFPIYCAMEGISLSGEEEPKTSYAPYVTGFWKSDAVANTEYKTISGELGNPFDAPLFVRRLQNLGFFEFGQKVDSIYTAAGNPVLLNQLDGVELVDITTSFLDVNFKLASKEQLFARLTPSASGMLTLGLQGYREVPVNAF